MREALARTAPLQVDPDRCEPAPAGLVGVEPIETVVMMEDHDGAYYAWKRAGITGRILVHIDAHLDWNWIADKNPLDLLQVQSLQQLEAMLDERSLWNLSGRRSEELVHIGNYIYPALVERIVKEFYWVVPDSFVTSPAEVRNLVRQFKYLKRINPQAMKTIRIENNRVVVEIEGKRVTACGLADLPEIQEPVLLDIDTDFLLPEPGDLLRSGTDPRRQLPWIWPEEVIRRLREKRVRTDFVTIAYSVEGGYTALNYKYLGDDLALRLKTPTSPEYHLQALAHKRLAASHRHHGDLEKAINELEHAVKLEPKDASGHFNLADLFDAQGTHDQAAARYRQAVQFDPTYATRYNNFGSIYESLGMVEKAREEYKRILRWDPQNADAQYGLAETLAHEGKWDEAIARYRAVIALRPAHAGSHRSLGFAYLKRDAWEEAINEFRRCVALKPNDGFAHHLLGEALLRQRRWNAAMEAFRAALRCGFRSISTHRRLGRLYLRKRMFYKALKQYRKVLRLRATVAVLSTRDRLTQFLEMLSRGISHALARLQTRKERPDPLAPY